ncbi:MAG: hypothetical protein IPP58_13715 [Holophagaceae bacterium]|uniref:Cytochrome C biogenesis protein transmembrane domain-containing protein n=1 Tax=Candidatus Geothrix skivensis TaxID=2954439 RepID=A0A9D7XMF2_9BACT|nr:hypothetical protein [Candidatus Geothrix skivensis]
MEGFIGRMADLVAQAPGYQQLGLVFLGGLLTSANPCVLVAAPLVVGFTGGTQESPPPSHGAVRPYACWAWAAFTLLWGSWPP